MDLRHPRLGYNSTGIGMGNTGAGKNRDTAGRLGDKLTQERQTLAGQGLVARGKDAMATAVDYLFESHQRMGTLIESPMKSDLHRSCKLHNGACALFINSTIGEEKPDNYSRGTGLVAEFDLLTDEVKLGIGIAKITWSRTQQDMCTKTQRSDAATYIVERWGKTTYGEVATQLDTAGAAMGSIDGRLERITAYFDLKHKIKKVSKLYHTTNQTTTCKSIDNKFYKIKVFIKPRAESTVA